ncbi:hypothetical protein [Nocardia salmonicida]|uniref:hypothetical protein n=1 Tax=Nocardia salmonicida TaxID=53431 RepID=UPI003CF97FD3
MADNRSGNPEVDGLIDAAKREYAESWKLSAISTAEATVARARLTDIAEQQKAAGRRWSAAKGLVTRAEKGGDAEKIAAARQRENDAYRELDAISRSGIDEGFGIVAAGNDRVGLQLEQM